jgi:hypothetical protein
MSWFSRVAEGAHFPLSVTVPRGAGRWVLLATAAIQATAPILIDFSGSDTDLPIVPAEYAFIIWSPIVLGCLAAAAYGLPRQRAASPAYRALHLRLSLVQLLFVAWLLAATSTAVWLTLPIFVTMLALTLDALRRVLATTTERRDRAVRWLLGGTLGVYAGWSTAAVWVNLATLLTDAGLDASGTVGLLWQALLLAAATASAVLVLRQLGGPLPYASAVGWAFLGVVVSSTKAGASALAAVATLGMLAVAVATATTNRRPWTPAPAE